MMMFNPRKVAGILKQHAIEELHRLQQRILIVERFGADAVTMTMLGSKGTEKLPQMLERHAELVAQIDALKAALDAASEIDLAAFVAEAKRRHNL